MYVCLIFRRPGNDIISTSLRIFSIRHLDCIKDMKLIAEGMAMVVFSFLEKHVVSAVIACFTLLTQSTQNASQQISLYFLENIMLNRKGEVLLICVSR